MVTSQLHCNKPRFHGGRPVDPQRFSGGTFCEEHRSDP